ncbi:hypothetical protein CALCODRAFT_169402 [Calocera cornea HHB12733]|uniref:Uncharacterized protein n=1 Tax=Calocera cornea HHB12733 TaxID=1353952 RepID=A0A165CGN2_9BASI|nr:hypothetical protein CALCODRAFT_169402 [Calocera cornea HHB12733]
MEHAGGAGRTTRLCDAGMGGARTARPRSTPKRIIWYKRRLVACRSRDATCIAAVQGRCEHGCPATLVRPHRRMSVLRSPTLPSLDLVCLHLSGDPVLHLMVVQAVHHLAEDASGLLELLSPGRASSSRLRMRWLRPVHPGL